jgi:hypothetical protein
VDGSDRPHEMERRLIERSLQDDAFRRRLLEDPRAAVEQELGTRLPEGVRVVAVEKTADTIYLVLPPTSQAGQPGDGLSDRELGAMAGGGTWIDNTCGGQMACGCDPSSRPRGLRLLGYLCRVPDGRRCFGVHPGPVLLCPLVVRSRVD